jgi:anthranilate synthase/aminodeoxychorismate synthase-like glutamine amidotransferase
MKVLFIDNFDSFVYNLVDEFEKRNCEVLVYRNDVNMKIIDDVITKFKPDLIVISSGSSTPKEAGNSIQIIKKYSKEIPIFGAGLGHQCIIETFGGAVGRASEIFHGKPSKIKHDNLTIFKGVENPFKAGRYHSLTALDVPYSFEISARSEKGIVMAVRHKEFFVEGVQFNPESILTPAGGLIIENLIKNIKK